MVKRLERQLIKTVYTGHVDLHHLYMTRLFYNNVSHNNLRKYTTNIIKNGSLKKTHLPKMYSDIDDVGLHARCILF
jgi:predicted transcriptional regulator